MASQDRILVVSAHAADFAIRAGGAIARATASGAAVRVLVQSLGARGESNEMWLQRKGKTTEAEVAEIRRKEAQAAAAILGVEIAFFDYPDQPLTFDRDRIMAIVREIRKFRPRVILTHPKHEPYNPDHATACQAALEAAYYATLAGVEPDLPIVPPTQILAFEPTQPMPEVTGFVPDTFIDITDVMERKLQAVAEYRVQPYHVERYRARAVARATQAAYLAGNPEIKFAEAYQRYTPWVGRMFP
ncbi:MAG: PIG-L family deacetylase [Armatimonadetes bacterium]|nr:PIG-L family deacetylase [Armatimonadota bacterium]